MGSARIWGDYPSTMIGPVRVATMSKTEAIQRIDRRISQGGGGIVAFCNAHSVNLARGDPAMCAAMDAALVLNDGVGLDIARRVLDGTAFPENLNGTDLTTDLLVAMETPRRIYLLGGKPGIAEAAAASLKLLAPTHQIVGVRDGYFTDDENGAVLRAIEASRADLILVGMGQPRQEMWALKNVDASHAVIMCIGAYLDFVAGAVPRAPTVIRMVRAEWVWRLAQEPRRLFGRYILGNPRFVLDIVKDRLRR